MIRNDSEFMISKIVHLTQKKSSLKFSTTNFIFPSDESCTLTSQEIQAAGESMLALQCLLIIPCSVFESAQYP